MLSILIFAHVPPPHHGQSYMVAQLLEELRARPDEIEVFHVDSRVSDHLEEVGQAGLGKVFRLLGHCWRAIKLRWKGGAMILYYVPAPAKRSALYRDWLVMAICRPFFRRLVLHWHAVGLGEWLDQRADYLTAQITRQLLGGANMSLVLADAVAGDAKILAPLQVRVLPNGIPDPCPDFDATLLPARLARAEKRREEFRVLFLAHCTREKGLFDTLEGIFIAQKRLNDGGSSVRLSLTVAGQFLSAEEQTEFQQTASRLAHEWHGPDPAPQLRYVGFASGQEKDRLFRESDCFCFPTFYANEVMPVALIEAMAYGLPIVSTRWRAIPEMLPEDGCLLVETHHPDRVGDALQQLTGVTPFAVLRAHFLATFQRTVFGQRFCAALQESVSG